MNQVQRTIYSAHLATTKMLSRPFSILPNSTLNQKFNIHANEIPSINEYPTLMYIGIGNKGASYDITTNGFVLTTPIPHLPRDASLYNFIPFVVRPIENDLSAIERLNYRIRVPMSIGSSNYVAYYLRVLDVSNIIPTVELRNVDNENISVSSFTPDISDLSPTQPDISNININNPNGDYLASTAKISFNLNQEDINNIMEAADTIYGDARYAVINEIALCTGVDKVVQGIFGSPENNVMNNYTDSIATQVAAFISQYHALTPATTEVNINIDVGSVLPLLT